MTATDVQVVRAGVNGIDDLERLWLALQLSSESWSTPVSGDSSSP